MQQTGTIAMETGEETECLDRALLARIAAGDRHGLEQLYSRYERSLFRFITSLTREPGLAEEILQDTFIAVWRGAASYQRRSDVRTWLFGIARRQTHDATRRRRLPEASEAEIESLADAQLTPEGELLARERRQDLATAVAHLSTIHRETLALIFIEGLSYQQAAEVLDVPVGTVKSRLNHARLALRTHLNSMEQDR